MIRAILTVKGGVGKTTTAMNLAAGFAKAGKKTLVIDFDGQANLSKILLRDQFPLEPTITEALSGKANIKDCIKHTSIENLDVIPSNIYLFSIERQMLQATAGIQQFKLKKLLKEINGYDEIIIDNNPSLNMCSTNALCTCEQVIIPTVADQGAEDGIAMTLEHCKEILEEIDGTDFDYRILLTMVHRNTIDRDYINQMYEQYGNHVFETKIRCQSRPVQDAGFQSMILIDNEKASVAQDYRDFIQEIMEVR